MKKKLIASVLALATCFAFGGALAGCSGKDGAAGANGTDGANGKSAYQIWLDQGNTGSEADFLNSLKGSGSATCDHENMLKAELALYKHTATYTLDEEGNKVWAYTNGKVLNVCVDCGYSAITEEVMHDISSEVTLPTCTAEGYTEVKCSVCEYAEEKTDIVPATDHNPDWDKAVPLEDLAGTNICEHGGYYVAPCSNPECNVSLSDAIPEDKLGHTYNVAELAMTKTPSATQAGELTGRCTNWCELTQTITLPALSETDYAVEYPNCLTKAAERNKVYTIYVNEKGEKSNEAKDGYTAFEVKVPHAEVTHYVEKDGVKIPMNLDKYPMKGDNSFKGIIKELADAKSVCGDEGRGIYDCAVCGETYEVTTYQAHNFSAPVLNEGETLTCTTGGLGTSTCADCDYKDTAVAMPALGHAWDYTLVEARKEVETKCTRCDAPGATLTYDKVYLDKSTESTCLVAGILAIDVIEQDGSILYKELPRALAPHSVTKDSITKYFNAADNTYALNLENSYAGYITEIGDKKATCTSTGKGIYTCGVCDETFDVITKLSHEASNGEKKNEVPATCQERGSYQVDCALCEELVTEYTDKLNHKVKYTLASTDFVTFTLTATCETCDYDKANAFTFEPETHTLAINGGDIVIEDIEGKLCGDKNCTSYILYDENGAVKASIDDPRSITYVPHVVEGVKMEGEWITVGEESFYVFNIDTFKKQIKEFGDAKAKCYENNGMGEGIYTCSKCDEVYNVITYKEHNITEDNATEVVTPGTCTTGAVVKGQCTNEGCNVTDDFTLDAPGHTWTVDVENGKVVLSCECNATHSIDIVLADYAETIITKPTCKDGGLSKYSKTFVDYEIEGFKYTFLVEFTAATPADGHKDYTAADVSVAEFTVTKSEEGEKDGVAGTYTWTETSYKAGYYCDCGTFVEISWADAGLVEIETIVSEKTFTANAENA